MPGIDANEMTPVQKAPEKNPAERMREAAIESEMRLNLLRKHAADREAEILGERKRIRELRIRNEG